MNVKEKYMIFCACAIAILPVILSTISGDHVTATDWTYRHVDWIHQYLNGSLAPIYQYLPGFHLLMMPFVAMDFPVKYFQILFIILSLFGVLFYAWKIEGERVLLITSMLLASSVAFVEFASALMPQSLDFLFFAFMMYFYFKKRPKMAMLLGVLDFSMHPTGEIMIFALLAHSLIVKNGMWKPILITFLILAPLSYFYFFISPTLFPTNWFTYDYAAQDAWESQYMGWKFFALSGFLMWALLPFALNRLYKDKFHLTEQQKLYIIIILSFLPMALMHQGIWRTMSYAVVPLSLLVASLLKNEEMKF